jgi:hypothetical protein
LEKATGVHPESETVRIIGKAPLEEPRDGFEAEFIHY